VARLPRPHLRSRIPISSDTLGYGSRIVLNKDKTLKDLAEAAASSTASTNGGALRDPLRSTTHRKASREAAVGSVRNIAAQCVSPCAAVAEKQAAAKPSSQGPARNRAHDFGPSAIASSRIDALLNESKSTGNVVGNGPGSGTAVAQRWGLRWQRIA
jgi:hypothetical protein